MLQTRTTSYNLLSFCTCRYNIDLKTLISICNITQSFSHHLSYIIDEISDVLSLSLSLSLSICLSLYTENQSQRKDDCLHCHLSARDNLHLPESIALTHYPNTKSWNNTSTTHILIIIGFLNSYVLNDEQLSHWWNQSLFARQQY